MAPQPFVVTMLCDRTPRAFGAYGGKAAAGRALSVDDAAMFEEEPGDELSCTGQGYVVYDECIGGH